MIKEIIILALALLLPMGWCVKDHEYVKEEHRAVYAAGDTLDELAGRYYHLDQRGISWAEFNHEVRLANKGKGVPQPGDVAVIPVWREK